MFSVSYTSSNKPLEALPSLIACDFEVASRLTKEEKEKLSERLLGLDSSAWKERVGINSQLRSNGLSHPTLARPMLLSIAWSPEEAHVVTLADDKAAKSICQWLVDIEAVQIWHNSAYDFSFIYYYTKRLPKHYEDTMLMMKCLTNDVSFTKSTVGLKELEKFYYGRWGLEDKSNKFTQEEMYEPEMLKYAATDACATYHLYTDILKELDKRGIKT